MPQRKCRRCGFKFWISNKVLYKGKNNKMKLLSNISTYSVHCRKGIIGENVEYISRLWNCSFGYLIVDVEISDRVRAITELTACKDNGDHLPIFDSSELSDLIGEMLFDIAEMWYQICILLKWQLHIYSRHSVYCSYMMHAYCTFLHILHLHLYHIISVPRVRIKHITFFFIYPRE